MAVSEILISEQTLKKIKDYHKFLCLNGVNKVGAHFKKQLNSCDIALADMDLNTFATLMVQSKIPKVFAESAVYHDERDWTLQEESILGDISIDVPVTIFNDGGHFSSFKNHETPISAHLAYVPGALLRSDLTGKTADIEEVIVNGKLNQDRLNDLYERRLLNQLLQINARAQSEGKLAAVTIPGIGTGQFAGAYISVIKEAFRVALEHVLNKHKDKLQQIDIVHYDPYEGDKENTSKIGHINYRVRPSKDVTTTGQLAYPEGSAAETHTLTSFVAWDQFSWPGNDYWPGDRTTDDGVKAASTDSMDVITGVQGTYNPNNGSYEPPKEYNNWQHLVKYKQLQFSSPIYVVSNNGKKAALKKDLELVQQKENEDDRNIEVASKTTVYEILSKTINVLLDSFDEKIKTIGTHSLDAKEKAQQLLESLKNAKAEAFKNPNPEKLESFKMRAWDIFKEATPVLQQDLGWGDYLSNLARAIVNQVTIFLAKALTLGSLKHRGFFAIKQSDAKEAADELICDIFRI